jgi:hypothetical protein
MNDKKKVMELWVFVEEYNTGVVSYSVWWSDDPYKPKQNRELELLGEITDIELMVLKKFDMVNDHTKKNIKYKKTE